MACVTWAVPWQFASFWCVSSLLIGTHDGAGPADAALVDNEMQFINQEGVEANVGMVLYNTTQNTSGQVTAVTDTTITATGVTWNALDAYRITVIDGQQIATIQHWLDIAASDVHAALGSVGACDCTLSSWGQGLLVKLNIIDAAAYYQCPCGQPRMTDAMRQRYLEWMSTQLMNIATGVIDVCQGATGSGFPAMGWASQSITEWAAAEIIVDDIIANS